MKLLGNNNNQPNQSQDDAAVGYVFQRHPHDAEYPHFAHKAPRWASGDDGIIDVSLLNNLIFFCRFFEGKTGHQRINEIQKNIKLVE